MLGPTTSSHIALAIAIPGVVARRSSLRSPHRALSVRWRRCRSPLPAFAFLEIVPRHSTRPSCTCRRNAPHVHRGSKIIALLVSHRRCAQQRDREAKRRRRHRLRTWAPESRAHAEAMNNMPSAAVDAGARGQLCVQGLRSVAVRSARWSVICVCHVRHCSVCHLRDPACARQFRATRERRPSGSRAAPARAALERRPIGAQAAPERRTTGVVLAPSVGRCGCARTLRGACATRVTRSKQKMKKERRRRGYKENMIRGGTRRRRSRRRRAEEVMA